MVNTKKTTKGPKKKKDFSRDKVRGKKNRNQTAFAKPVWN